jgi:hypothetical protein
LQERRRKREQGSWGRGRLGGEREIGEVWGLLRLEKGLQIREEEEWARWRGVML